MTTATPPRPLDSLSGAAPASSKGDALLRAPLAALALPGLADVEVFHSQPGMTPRMAWTETARPSEAKLAEWLATPKRPEYWVRRHDYARVIDAVQKSWTELAASRKLRPCDRFALMSMAHSLELSAMVRLVNCRPFIETGKRLGAEAGTIFAEEPIASRELYEAVRSAGAGTFRALTVAGYTLQMAALSGVTQLGRLSEIGVGALVHDVGARNSLVDAWAHPGRWSDEERHVIQGHPQAGYEDLLAAGFTHGQLMMAYQHHEHVDGTGYPVGILGEEMHPWAKMLAVADRFEALTSGRSYRKAKDLPAALMQLQQEAGVTLDAETTKCWIKSL